MFLSSHKKMNPESLLRDSLTRKKNYSQRALARDLGVSASFVSDFLKGNKPIPVKHVDRLVQLLDMDFESACRLKKSLNTFDIDGSLAQNPLSDEFEYLRPEQSALLNKWYYPAMLELMTVEQFDGDFCSALDISEYEAEFALDILTKLKLAEKSANGKYLKSNITIRLSSNRSREAIRNYHRMMMSRAKSDLLKVDQESFDKRFIGGLSLTVAAKDVEYAKLKISKFMHELSLELSAGDVDSVYHLATQFFPVANVELEEKQEGVKLADKIVSRS